MLQAPNFNLLDQDNTLHKLDDYAGCWLVVYFYPKDDTPGCTKEACGFRDLKQTFANSNAKIVGISADSPESHKKFAQKYNLNFPLLSDPDKSVAKAFGAFGEKKFMGKTYQGIKRNTYIINPDGKIVKVFENVNPIKNPMEVLEFLGGIQDQSS